MQQLVPSPSQQGRPLHGLVSLLAMLSPASMFVAATKVLRQFRDDFRASDPKRSSAEAVASCIDMLGYLEELGGYCPIPVTIAGAKRLRKCLEGIDESKNYAGASRMIEEVEERFFDELSAIKMFVVTKHLEKTDVKNTLGETVCESFPTSSIEIEEAGWCLALGRSTACVLHLMRALEIPLALLADDLLVDNSKANWNAILNDIEAQVRGRDVEKKKKLKSLPSGFWNSRDKEFYSDVTTHFFSIKNAWRNHAVHGRDSYTTEQASVIFVNTTELIRCLSVQFAEPDG